MLCHRHQRTLGDGKTTVLNFVAEILKDEPSTIPLWYNPWRYLNEEVMLAGLFASLAAAVRLELKTKGERIANTFVKFGPPRSPRPSPLDHPQAPRTASSSAGLSEVKAAWPHIERVHEGVVFRRVARAMATVKAADHFSRHLTQCDLVTCLKP